MISNNIGTISNISYTVCLILKEKMTYKTKMIDAELWSRWEATAKSMMTIPKFKKVWNKTKDSRSYEFRELVDSLPTDL